MVEEAKGDDVARVQAAQAALGEIRAGMKLGLGTGRTATHFVKLLGSKVRDGLDVIGVPTSERAGELARAEGIRLTTLDEQPALDLVVDGADEVDPSLRLIKGGGGALLREKIVATASARMLVIVEAGKMVDTLGAFPLPIEVVPFGLGATRRAIEAAAARLNLTGDFQLRSAGSGPYVTDGGHYLLDATFGRIPDPESLSSALHAIPGVVEHGLFIGIASQVIVGRDDGVDWLPPR